MGKFQRALLWTVIGATAGMGWGAMHAGPEVALTWGSILGGGAGGAFWGGVAAMIYNRTRA